MRVLQTIASLEEATGGPPRAALELARGLAQQGDEADVATLRVQRDPTKILADAGIEDVVVHSFARGPLITTAAFSAPAIRWLLQNVRTYDVVVVHSPYLVLSIAAMFAARMRGVPYIFRPHGSWDPAVYDVHEHRNQVLNMLQSPLVEGARLIWWTADGERDAARYRPRRPRDLVLPLGVSTELLAVQDEVASFRKAFPQIGADYAIYLGRLHHVKGLDLLLESFSMSAAARQGLQLVLAGSDYGFEAELRDITAQLHLQNQVHFIGHITGRVKVGALQAARFSTLPTRGENFGIAAAEALALGTPVLVSDRLSSATWLAKSGAVQIAPLEPPAMAHAIDRIYQDVDKNGRELRARAHAFAADNLQWNRVAEGFKAAITTMMV